MLTDLISSYLDKEIRSLRPLSGGDINEVFLIDTSSGHLVAKVNQSDRFPEMFIKEANGLNALRDKGLRVPEVVGNFERDRTQVLLLEYLPPGEQDFDYWDRFALGLASLHRTTSANFGWNEANYIGSLRQDNTSYSNWATFFCKSRLRPMVDLALSRNLLTQTHVKRFEKLYTLMKQLLPDESPSLIHGDLWSGNVFCTLNGEPVIIDPATYYGHREMDLAMTMLFGGFSYRFIEVYAEEFPLENGWRERIELHNLYPNLVHLNLFGRSYLRSIEAVIDRYV